MSRYLTEAEIAYILCGLRMLQHHLETTRLLDVVDRDIVALRQIVWDEGHEIPDASYIDDLCEAINLGEVKL